MADYAQILVRFSCRYLLLSQNNCAAHAIKHDLFDFAVNYPYNIFKFFVFSQSQWPHQSTLIKLRIHPAARVV
jgi:hypothetical protein